MFFNKNRSKLLGSSATVALAAIFAIAGIQRQANAAVVFSDTFPSGSSSSINSASPSAPTSTSTAYVNIGSKNMSPVSAITTGSLKFGIAATTSGHIETQALFTTSPVTLTNVGDSIELKVTFKDTGLLLTGASTSGHIGFGLYQAGGVGPYTGGLIGSVAPNATTSTASVSGGSQAWQGYVTRISASTGTNRIGLRPSQSAVTTGNNQTGIAQGSGSQAYTGNVALGSNATSTVVLTDAAIYTEYLKITLSAASTYTIDSNLYTGTDSSGTNMFSQTATATGANYLSSGFDSIAIGYRQTTNTASAMDISSITVTTVPEPTTMAMISLSSLALLRRKSRIA